MDDRQEEKKAPAFQQRVSREQELKKANEHYQAALAASEWPKIVDQLLKAIELGLPIAGNDLFARLIQKSLMEPAFEVGDDILKRLHRIRTRNSVAALCLGKTYAGVNEPGVGLLPRIPNAKNIERRGNIALDYLEESILQNDQNAKQFWSESIRNGGVGCIPKDLDRWLKFTGHLARKGDQAAQLDYAFMLDRLSRPEGPIQNKRLALQNFRLATRGENLQIAGKALEYIYSCFTKDELFWKRQEETLAGVLHDESERDNPFICLQLVCCYCPEENFPKNLHFPFSKNLREFFQTLEGPSSKKTIHYLEKAELGKNEALRKIAEEFVKALKTRVPHSASPSQKS